MKAKIDFKSAVLGLGIGVAATLGVGAMASGQGPVGRYQIAGASGHGLVIDTATGRVWQAFLPQESGSTDPDFAAIKSGNTK